MAETLSTYFAKFVADMDGFTAPLREAQKQSKELTDSLAPVTKGLKDLGDFATKAGAALTLSVTAPIVAFGVAAVKNFDESAKAVAQMEAALISTGGTAGRTAEQLTKLASSLEAKSIHDDDEILKGIIDTLLQFGSVSGKVFDQASQAALNLADRYGKDLQSAAILVGKALDDPIKGLTALQKVGVTFTADQKDMIKQLVETGHQMEAQQLILDKLNDKFAGTSESISKVGTGPMKQLEVQIGNMTESWGKLITEALNPLIVKASEVVKWMDTWSESTKVLVGSAAGIAAAIGPVVFTVGQLSIGVANMIPLISKLSVTFLGAEGSAVLFSNALTASGIVAGLTVGAYVALAAELVLVGKMLYDVSVAEKDHEKAVVGLNLATEKAAEILRTKYNVEIPRGTMSVEEWNKAVVASLQEHQKLDPVLQKNIENNKKSAASAKENAEQTAAQKKATEEFNKAVDAIVQSVMGNTLHTNELTAAVKQMEAAHVPAEDIVKRLGSQLKNEADYAEASGKALNETLAPLNAMRLARQAIIDQGQLKLFPADLKQQTEDAQKLMTDAASAINTQLKQVVIDQNDALKDQVGGLEDLMRTSDLTYKVWMDASSQNAKNQKIDIGTLKDAWGDAFGSMEGFDEEWVRTNQANAGKTKDAHKDAAETMQQAFATAMGNVTADIAKGFTDIIFNGGSFKDKMVDIAKQTAESMMQAFLVGLLSPLTNELAKLGKKLADTLAKAAGGGGGGGGGGGSDDSSGSIDLGKVGGAIGGAVGKVAGSTAFAAAAPFATAALAAYLAIKDNQKSDVASAWTPLQAQFDSLPNKVTADYQDYLQAIYEWSQHPGSGFQVSAQQALDTFTKYYGDPSAYGVDIVLPKPWNNFIQSGPSDPGHFSLMPQAGEGTGGPATIDNSGSVYGNEAYRNILGVDPETYKRLFPSAATGLERVPYDDYPVLLHQDERVLTAAESEAYRRSGGVINAVFNIQVKDGQDLLRQIRYNTSNFKQELKEALA